MSSQSSSSRSSGIKWLIAVIVLLVLVVGLGLAYYFLTRPPESGSEQGTKERSFLFSIYGFEGDLLRRPSGVAVAANGDIYVADTGKRRIVVFNADGNYVTTYGDQGKEKNQIWEPISVAVSPDGRSYVVDKGQKKMILYDSAHKPIKEIVFKDEAPLSVNVANNLIFVTTPSGVLIGNLDGEISTGFINRGKDPGQYDMPGGVAVGTDGTLYVADSLNYRIQAIDKQGKSIWQYGKPVPADQAVNYNGPDRKFGLPASIAIDERGFLYVADGLSSELVVLNNKGELVETVGDVGHNDGTFYYPEGITYGDGRLVVADKFNDRIEVFRLPTATAGTNVGSYAPWALLLLLVPLAAWLLFRRRGGRYVLAPDFVAAMIADSENGAEVAGSLGPVFATSSLVASSAGQAESLKLRWREQTPKPDEAQALAADFSLVEGQAGALAVAAAKRDKRILLTDDPQARAAAEKIGVSTLTYQNVLSALGKDISTALPDSAGEA